MRLSAIILLGMILNATAIAAADSERLECSLVMPETMIDCQNPARDKSLLLALKIKNISSADAQVCTYRNGMLELSSDGKEWQPLEQGSDHRLAARIGNFKKLIPQAAAYELISCQLRSNADGVILYGEHNTGDCWATPPLKDGTYYLRCRYTYPDPLVTMMNETLAGEKSYPGNYFPWKACVQGVWLTNSVKFTVKN